MLIDIPLNKAYSLLTGGPTVLVTSKSPDGRDNVMANAWNTVFNMDPSQVIVVFDLEHNSTANILKTGEFGISVPGTNLRVEMLTAGGKHLREIEEDKFTYAHLQKLAPQVIGAPLVEGALGHLECRVMDMGLLASTGIALAEVVAARVEADYWNGDSLVCDGRPQQTLHSACSKAFFPRGLVQPWGRRSSL